MDIDIPQLKALLSALVEGGVTEFEFEEGGAKLHILRGPTRELVVASSAPGPTYVTSVPQDLHHAEHGPASSHHPPASQPPPSVSGYTGGSPNEDADVTYVTSPFVGTFYRQPSPDAPPFVEIGSKVREGQTLCIVEAMKLMNELEADASGVIVDILVENGKSVEFGQKLFKLRSS